MEAQAMEDQCIAPLDFEAWENCEYCHASKEKGLVCGNPEGPDLCPQDFDDALREMYPESEWGEDDHS